MIIFQPIWDVWNMDFHIFQTASNHHTVNEQWSWLMLKETFVLDWHLHEREKLQGMHRYPRLSMCPSRKALNNLSKLRKGTVIVEYHSLVVFKGCNGCISETYWNHLKSISLHLIHWNTQDIGHRPSQLQTLGGDVLVWATELDGIGWTDRANKELIVAVPWWSWFQKVSNMLCLSMWILPDA